MAGKTRHAGSTYKVREMDMALGIQQNIVRLDITMDDALAVDVAQRAAQLGDPEANGLFGEGLAGDVEAQVAAAHEIDDQIPIAGQPNAFRGETGAGRTCIRCLGSCSADCR